jgi:trigger factor
LAIIEKVVADTKVEVPEILIASEIQKMMYKLEADITNMGFKMEDYLKQINKTPEDISVEWRPDAEKRAKLELIIHNISVAENLKPTDEEVEKEADMITKMYKDADPVRARAYVEQILTNEKVFAFLSSQ